MTNKMNDPHLNIDNYIPVRELDSYDLENILTIYFTKKIAGYSADFKQIQSDLLSLFAFKVGKTSLHKCLIEMIDFSEGLYRTTVGNKFVYYWKVDTI